MSCGNLLAKGAMLICACKHVTWGIVIHATSTQDKARLCTQIELVMGLMQPGKDVWPLCQMLYLGGVLWLKHDSK